MHTFTGNRALQIEEGLIFEFGRYHASGVDFEKPEKFTHRLGGLERQSPLDLPGLTEPEALRHYVRLSQKNYGIDSGPFPLGSCTMKHNARLNERMSRLPGFADIHPLQPFSTVQGALEVMDQLSHYLLLLTGMEALALSPKAGAHGELCGMMAIKAAITDKEGEKSLRRVVLVPESAHGTNPATAALLGFQVQSVPVNKEGIVDFEAIVPYLGPNLAGIMLTNPNTCGLFERNILLIAEAVHQQGGYFYCDGANFNAIVGKVRPGDLGIDAMHINLHKTFSTPHGGGGPGAGPVVFSRRLAPYAPRPYLRKDFGGTFSLVETDPPSSSTQDGLGKRSLGRLCAFHGQMGMFVRALTYMLSHGGDGLRQASEDAVLNANYVRANLADLMSLPFGNKACMHEVVFDDTWLKGTSITTLDFAKALIDEGYHPMTIYFPLIVRGAMLIEPTESESKASLDLFIATLRHLAIQARQGHKERFSESAPYHAPRTRPDETQAARKPVLRWKKPTPAVPDTFLP